VRKSTIQHAIHRAELVDAEALEKVLPQEVALSHRERGDCFRERSAEVVAIALLVRRELGIFGRGGELEEHLFVDLDGAWPASRSQRRSHGDRANPATQASSPRVAKDVRLAFAAPHEEELAYDLQHFVSIRDGKAELRDRAVDIGETGPLEML
jgi:hypothetical protein